MAAELDGRRSGLPEKAAVRVCEPTGKALITRPGALILDAGRIAKGIPPSENVTVPRANVGPPGDDTVPNNVTGAPNWAVGDPDVIAMVLATGVNVTVSGAELLCP